ncbi:DedA family protein [Candidatus Gracilibacteria bacterium]|nr:DedA family protein [Candidatus Gracilibacteria bacterium]
MKHIIHTLMIASLFLMFAFIILSLFRPDLLLPMIEWIKVQVESLGKWNYLLAFISALLESLPIVGTIVPGQAILLSVGGFYGGLGYIEFLGVLISAILGSIVSNWIGYMLGKHYGEEFFKKYGMWVGIEQTELKYLKNGVNTWGPWGIILSKFHAHARSFLPFIAGSMGFLSKKFWIYNIIASTLWAAIFVTIGVFFAEHYEVIVQYIGYIMLGIILSILAYFWFFKRESLVRYWQEKNKEMEEKYKK